MVYHRKTHTTYYRSPDCSSNFQYVGYCRYWKTPICGIGFGHVYAFVLLGLSAICIREIVFNPKRSQLILATAFYLRLISWIVIFIGIIVYFNFSKSSPLKELYFIIAISYLFKLTDVFEYYLLAKKWTM